MAVVFVLRYSLFVFTVISRDRNETWADKAPNFD